MTTLSTLDSDLLQSIIVAIFNLDDGPDSFTPKKDRTRLIPLSLVSKRLRAECLPHLFREYRHIIDQPGRLIPKTLWCFIKVLRITDNNVYFHDIDNQVLAAKELWEAFPEMNAVTTCIYTRVSGPDVTFVKALTSLPSLSSLELVNSTFQTSMDPEFNHITGLTRVAFRLTDQWRRHSVRDRWDVSVIQREAYNLFVLLSSSSSTLEYIEIPGETAYPEDLSAYNWPRLRHLVLEGVVPDRSLISWLRRTPRLRELNVQCLHAANSPHFMIYPDPQFDEASRFPDLQSLTLANPFPKDRIFDYLSDVHYLSFIPLPPVKYFAEEVSALATPIWNATQAKEALLQCPMPNLVELRVSVQDHGCSALIHAISQSFPSLEVLELHRHPMTESESRSTEQFACYFYLVLLDSHSFVIQEIVLPLGVLPRLTDLRLDLNFRSEEEMEALTYRAHGELHTKTALLVAENLPHLKSLCLLYRSKPMGRFPKSRPVSWQKFNVSRTANEVSILVEEWDY